MSEMLVAVGIYILGMISGVFALLFIKASQLSAEEDDE